MHSSAFSWRTDHMKTRSWSWTWWTQCKIRQGWKWRTKSWACCLIQPWKIVTLWKSKTDNWTCFRTNHSPTFTWHLQKANACCYQHEQQTSMQQEAENKLQCSILFSDKLSFLWKFCNKRTLQCSCGLPGWAKNASRCFFLSQEPNKWEDACRECLGLGGWPGLLSWMQKTNMTTQFVQLHPQKDLHSAWIGLQDMEKEVDQLQQTHVRCHLLETSGARWCHRFLGHGWGRTGLCC